MTVSIPFGCPQCGTGLREYRGRLVCDACTSMLITDADLVTSIEELGVSPVTIEEPDEIVDGRASRPAGSIAEWRCGPIDCPACPRCSVQMVSARINAARTPTFARCANHGVWFGPGQLAGLFARINHVTHLGAGRGRTYGGVGTSYGAGSGLWISERRGPRTITPFVSALADTTLVCPRCTDELHLHHDHWACDLCHGVFVEQVALEAMIVEMTHGPWRLEPSSGPTIGRPCPACSHAMTAETIEEVGVARCGVHGVWFDTPNLATVLENAATATHGSALGNWLRQAFRRV